MRLKAIGSLITGILLLILGIILTITLNSPKSLILSGIGILTILFALLQFKLAKKSIKDNYKIYKLYLFLIYMNYEEMLDQGMKALPEKIVKTERFEIPKVKGHIQGNKTIITNFYQIVQAFRREEEHFLKYLLRELATPGKLEGTLLIIGRKISSTLINQKIKQYAHTYVLCFTCGKPDTQIIVKEGKTLLKCTACGAQIPIK